MPSGTPVKHKKKTKSVLKNIRQAERRATVNRVNRTRVRGAMKRLRAALASGDADSAAKLMGPTFSEVDRSVRVRILPENTANRYKSRLTLALNSLRATKKA
jgi:small subunit ribosomal protein S20